MRVIKPALQSLGAGDLGQQLEPVVLVLSRGGQGEEVAEPAFRHLLPIVVPERCRS